MYRTELNGLRLSGSPFSQGAVPEDLANGNSIGDAEEEKVYALLPLHIEFHRFQLL